MIHIFLDLMRGQVDGWILAKLVSFVIALLCIWMGPDNDKSWSIVDILYGHHLQFQFVFIVIEFRFAKLVLIFVVSTAVKIYRRSVLGTCSTCGSVAEDRTANLPLSATTETGVKRIT